MNHYALWRLERIAKAEGRLAIIPLWLITAPFAVMNDVARQALFLLRRWT